MTEVFKIVTIKGWQEFIELADTFEKNKFIFRGQSNAIGAFWKIQSSFDRLYQSTGITFIDYISQRYDEGLFSYYFKDYKFPKKNNLLNASLLDKLYFFQHYGIPTCLIDFTKDPLKALYFSICNIIIPRVKSYQGSNHKIFSEYQYFSIFRLDYQSLISFYGVPEIGKLKLPINDISDYDNDVFYKSLKNCVAYRIYLDLNPKPKNQNYNLKKQDGCFLLFDNSDNGNNIYSFEDYLEQFYKPNELTLKEPLLVRYDIPYNSIFKKWSNHKEDDSSLFKYLQSKKISGKELFDDLQGFKYDSNLSFMD